MMREGASKALAMDGVRPSLPPSPCRSPSQAGFTLPEVLIALVILSVGLTGLALLALEGIASTRSANYRVLALGLAADFAERFRANPAGGLSYAGSGPGTRGGCVNGDTPCSPADLAGEDWHGWMSELMQVLPLGATAQVDVVSGAPADLTIELRWAERALARPVTQTLRLRVAP